MFQGLDATIKDQIRAHPWTIFVEDDFYSTRRDIRAVLVTAVHSKRCHGGIFPDNVVLPNFQSAVLGSSRPLLNLWTHWINASSSNVAFIPPEGVAALPASTGDTSKVDSWALGCLTIWFIDNEQPLELSRHMRNVSHVLDLKQPLLPRLQALYKNVGQHKKLFFGPKLKLARPVPSVCEDFLGRCLAVDPAKRWSLQQLRAHPFLDPSKSTEELFALDTALFKHQLSFKEASEPKESRGHAVLMIAYATVLHQQGELVYEHRQPRAADMWRFAFHVNREQQRQRVLWTSLKQLVNALTMEANKEEWASICRIRELQEGSKNVVQNLGCKCVEVSNWVFSKEMLVVTEHCAGGSLKEAAKYKLPIDIIAKWTREVLQGLQYLYGHRIVHRNINSGNILFSAAGFKGTIKIGGFHYIMWQHIGRNNRKMDRNFRTEMNAQQGQDGRFAAPETLEFYTANVNLERKCDIWSFGCVVLHLVSGAPPLYIGDRGKPITFEMAIIYHVHSNKALPRIDEWIPANVQEFIKTCLQLNPQARPSATELLQRLETGSFGLIRQFRPDTAQYLANREGKPLPNDVAEYWRTYP
ncbi:uncharacterized protein LOC129597492 [Paramacrobiotus metropolitanus]|uniref:uncharacterized protein LOC129597492 n=1 Tax=Paramacrobiotus metropolitanus TaxID=2943436 RepID=UPI0024456C0D|nr:uncharacterized protein LOC129597492 [Paramacrobiotus metropolitanus]